MVFCVSSANATPKFEGRGGEDLAQEISSALATAYDNRKCLDLEALCIINSQQCWVLYIDILVSRVILLLKDKPQLGTIHNSHWGAALLFFVAPAMHLLLLSLYNHVSAMLLFRERTQL